MRPILSLALLCLLAAPCLAQQPAVALTQADQALPIPVPTNAKLRVEVDTRGTDFLGVLKSLLSGFNGDTLGSAAAAVLHTTGAPGTPSQTPPALANANLADLFKDINHVHMVVLELPTDAQVKPAAPALSPALTAAGALTAPGIAPFYEQAFVTQGGHRILWVDGDASRLLTVGFPRGFALVAQQPGLLVVLRTDGYPSPSALGPILALIARVAPAFSK